jgi:hypothetical protein
VGAVVAVIDFRLTTPLRDPLTERFSGYWKQEKIRDERIRHNLNCFS